METNKQEPIYRPYLISLWALCVALILSTLITNCTPQKRLDRLIKNHPELAKTDTVHIVKTFTLAPVKIDTSINFSYYLGGLDTIFNNYQLTIDSLQKRLLKKDIKTFIVNRKVLDDTLNIKLKNNGFVKVYQSGKKLVYQMWEPGKVIEVKTPVIVTKYETVTKRSWSAFFGGFFACVLMLFIIGMIYKPKI